MKKGKLEALEWRGRFTYSKNVPFDESALRCSGARFQIVKFAPGRRVPPHHHLRTVEIFYVRSGCGLIRMNGVDIPCGPDDFVLCEPGDVHEFINSGAEEFVILIFKTNEKEGDIHWQAGVGKT